jgi:hypothetical protein
MAMPASACAQSAKNGIKVPSAMLATKNRKSPTRAALGMPRNVAKAEVKILNGFFTSQLLTPARHCPHDAGDVGLDASDDVNAYGARWRAVRALLPWTARRNPAPGLRDV